MKGSKTEVRLPDPVPTNTDEMATRRKFSQVLVSSFFNQRKLFLKVSIIFVSTTFFIFLLVNNGVIIGLVDYLGPLTEFFKLPPSCILPVGTYMFSPLVGASSIGAMLKDGMLSDLQGITACILGSWLMLTIFTLRYSFVRYVSIFGFSLGSSILLISTGLGMLNRTVSCSL
ncbi:MAG: hypothetical protein SWO11_00470 [Thermodesulfobacteriota bacterium]|nr:hypothetical protein [Thermodesulfobacteriota bacterium]